MTHFRTGSLALALLLSIAGCSDDVPNATDPSPFRRGGPPVFETSTEIFERRAPTPPERNAYFGDLHVHTTYSFDAFAFGTIATPSDAYRYARGDVLRHPGGFDVQLREPLDFYAVTDHAMFLGVVKTAADTSTEFSKHAFSEPLHDLNAPGNDGTLDLLRRLRTSAPSFRTWSPRSEAARSIPRVSSRSRAVPGATRSTRQTCSTIPAASPPSQPTSTPPPATTGGISTAT